MRHEVTAATVDFVAAHEGFVPHVYRDSRGYITFGYGFRPPLQAYPWAPSVAEAEADTARISNLANTENKSHRYYAKFCKASLPEAACRALLSSKLQRLADSPTLLKDWRLAELPPAAATAVLDMAYNLGVSGLGKFLRLRAAVCTANWQIAANECKRSGPAAARNAATSALFLSCL